MQGEAKGSRKIPSEDQLRGRGRRTQAVGADQHALLSPTCTGATGCWNLDPRPMSSTRTREDEQVTCIGTFTPRE